MDLPEVVTVKLTLFSASQVNRVMVEVDTSGEQNAVSCSWGVYHRLYQSSGGINDYSLNEIPQNSTSVTQTYWEGLEPPLILYNYFDK